MKLDTSEWKEFLIEDIFDITRGKTLTQENKMIYAGVIPCVNGITENNGVFCKLDKEIISQGFALQKAPAITLVRVGNAGKTFVQTKDFFVADNAFSLKLKFAADIYVYMFLSTVLDLEIKKYSYGRTIAIEKYKKSKIKLPVSKDGSPDYNFMDRYIRGLHHKKLTTRIKPCKTEFDFSKWKNFRLADLFDLKKGKRLTKADMISGDINYLGAISENNGVREKIETDYFWPPNCITVNYNGSVGEAFYQAKPFWASDDVNVLYAKDFWEMNKYAAMFLITVIKANKYRFGYGRKWTIEKMKETVIKLPAKADGTPDFIYMENYIKSLPYSDRI